MRRRTVLSVVFLVLVFAAVLYLGWNRNRGTSQFEAAFAPGGKITLDLSVGGYTVQGTTDNKISVVINQYDAPDVHSEIHVNGNAATVTLEGPSNNFHATINVPQHTDLQVHQTVGDIRILNVEGNKDVGLNIGHIRIEVPDTNIRSVDASAKIGHVHAAAWRRGRGGFFPSFHAHGQGPYSVTATLDIGDIELSN